MTERLQADLANQSLGRALTGDEQAFAAALQRIFAGGVHDPDAVAKAMVLAGVARPSGASDAWSSDALEHELRLINGSLDEAYAAHGRERLA